MFPFEMFVKERVGEKRFRHSVNVAKTARWLAFKYDANEDKAVVAGILHDITKEWTVHEHMTFLHSHNIGISKYEYTSVKLLHAVTASCYAKVVLRIHDTDILNAIRFHTTARANMSLLEKIVYLADGISEERKYSGVNELRYLADYDLNEAIFKEICGVISSDLIKKERLIHPNTIHAYNEYVFINSKESTQIKMMGKNEYTRKVLH